jgi:glucose/arabinose dehydrogenase
VQRINVDPRSPRRRPRSAFAAIVVAVVLAGCAGTSSATPTGESTASVTAPPTPTAQPSLGSSSSAASPGSGSIGPTGLGLKLVTGGLDAPLDIVDPGDASGRLFIVEQGGLIRIVKDGKLVAKPFLDIHDRVSCCDERGLLGLAFAPQYGSSDDRFFLDYTDVNGDTAIASASVGPDPDVADPTSLKVLLSIAQPFPNHNGGDIVFGRDGDLYIGMGDGGSGGDPQGNGQSLDTLLGKLLRIDVISPPPSGKAYVVPSTNPFVGRAGAKPEIWSYGLRNPWRFSFDSKTGDLWIGDVGQDRFEEVDRATKESGGGRGADFGWNIMEASHCYPDGDSCDKTGLVLPITEYDHSLGDCAVVGGYVYRGTSFQALDGLYLFGDDCSGYIRAVEADGPPTQAPALLLMSGRTISAFGEDAAGELYLTDLTSGELYEVTAGR